MNNQPVHLVCDQVQLDAQDSPVFFLILNMIRYVKLQCEFIQCQRMSRHFNLMSLIVLNKKNEAETYASN